MDVDTVGRVGTIVDRVRRILEGERWAGKAGGGGVGGGLNNNDTYLHLLSSLKRYSPTSRSEVPSSTSKFYECNGSSHFYEYTFYANEGPYASLYVFT